MRLSCHTRHSLETTVALFPEKKQTIFFYLINPNFAVLSMLQPTDKLTFASILMRGLCLMEWSPTCRCFTQLQSLLFQKWPFGLMISNFPENIWRLLSRSMAIMARSEKDNGVRLHVQWLGSWQGKASEPQQFTSEIIAWDISLFVTICRWNCRQWVHTNYTFLQMSQPALILLLMYIIDTNRGRWTLRADYPASCRIFWA